MADGLLSGAVRRSALDDVGAGLIRYIPPEWRALAGLIAEANPVRGMERAGQAAVRLTAPGATPMQRLGATGDVLSEMAGVVAPAAVAGRAGMPAVQAVQEGLLGMSAPARAAGEAVIERLNQPGPMPTLYSFGGQFAHTADLIALGRAKQMEAEGTDRGMIWGQTGWYRGGDGKWRFEIGDEGTGLEPAAYRDLLKNYFASGEMGDLFRANDLYQAYPDLARIDTTMENTRGQAASSGVYTPPRSREHEGLFDITEEISVRGGVEPGFSYGGRPARLERYLPQRGTLLHELQHAIQEREGFARGASPMYSSGVPREEAFAAYRAAPGEIEARNVEERADMPGLLRRMVAPWETADMPSDEELRLRLSTYLNGG